MIREWLRRWLGIKSVWPVVNAGESDGLFLYQRVNCERCEGTGVSFNYVEGMITCPKCKGVGRQVFEVPIKEGKGE
jgi:DnaJ-class molecular chaperone